MAILELAIAVANRGRGRVQAGDIVAARLPVGYVGQKEQADLIWIIVDTDIPREAFLEGSLSAKRLRHVDIDELIARVGGLDSARVKDPNVRYQPGIDPDPQTGKFRRRPSPFAIDPIMRTKA